jgi:hypothetical protein
MENIIVYRALSLVALTGFVAPAAIVQTTVTHDTVAQANTANTTHARTATRIPGTFAVTVPGTSPKDPQIELQDELRVLMPARAGDA